MRASKRGSRARPLSTTTRTPSTVSEVSAMSVDSTTRRRPDRDGANAASCSASDSAPASAKTSTSGPTVSRSIDSLRRISPMPGRNTRTSPVCSRSARLTAATTSGSIRLAPPGPGRDGRPPRRPPALRPPPVGDRGAQCISTSNMRPSLSITDASSRAVRPSTSGVADIASSRSSGRIVEATSSASARPRSVVRLRSCTSSKITRPIPGSSGSFCRRRVSTPSVTTSMRVSVPMWRSSRVW